MNKANAAFTSARAMGAARVSLAVPHWRMATCPRWRRARRFHSVSDFEDMYLRAPRHFKRNAERCAAGKPRPPRRPRWQTGRVLIEHTPGRAATAPARRRRQRRTPPHLRVGPSAPEQTTTLTRCKSRRHARGDTRPTPAPLCARRQLAQHPERGQARLDTGRDPRVRRRLDAPPRPPPLVAERRSQVEAAQRVVTRHPQTHRRRGHGDRPGGDPVAVTVELVGEDRHLERTRAAIYRLAPTLSSR